MFNVLLRHPGHGWIDKTVPDLETLKALLDKGGSVFDDQQRPILIVYAADAAAPVIPPAPVAPAAAPVAPAPVTLPRVAAPVVPPGFKLVPVDAVVVENVPVDPNAQFFVQAPAPPAAAPAPKLV